MPNALFISDLHFGHANCLNFEGANGGRMRNFETVEEMNETIIERCNKVVKPKDRLYILGDVAIKRKDIQLVERLNGRKVLVRGNHDIFQLKDYLPYFDDIRGVHVMPSRVGILSHVPLHPDSVGRFKLNIHGHTHDRCLDDSRYFNVSCEVLDYTPISYEEILSKVGLK